MGKKTVNIILMVVTAFVVAACGAGKANVVRTSAKGLVRSMKPQEIADTADCNTKLRHRYFYEEAAKQQALGHYDAAYELATPAAPDMYTFAYWSQEDGTAIMQTGCWKIAADVTLTAKWSKPYTITFVQTGQKPITRQVPAGGTLTDIPEPVAKTGYTIVWEKKDYTNITRSFTVNSVETANVYKIHYDLGALSGTENISGYIPTQDVTFNEPYNLISPSYNGYSFVKWVLKDSKTEFKNGIYTMTQDVYLTALWEIPEDSDGAWMKKQY